MGSIQCHLNPCRLPPPLHKETEDSRVLRAAAAALGALSVIAGVLIVGGPLNSLNPTIGWSLVGTGGALALTSLFIRRTKSFYGLSDQINGVRPRMRIRCLKDGFPPYEELQKLPYFTTISRKDDVANIGIVIPIKITLTRPGASSSAVSYEMSLPVILSSDHDKNPTLAILFDRKQHDANTDEAPAFLSKFHGVMGELNQKRWSSSWLSPSTISLTSTQPLNEEGPDEELAPHFHWIVMRLTSRLSCHFETPEGRWTFSPNFPEYIHDTPEQLRSLIGTREGRVYSITI